MTQFIIRDLSLMFAMTFDKGNKNVEAQKLRKIFFFLSFSSRIFGLKKAQQEAAAQISRFLNGQKMREHADIFLLYMKKIYVNKMKKKKLNNRKKLFDDAFERNFLNEN